MKPAEIQAEKAALRRRMRGKLAALAPEVRAVASKQVCDQLRSQEIWQRARAVLLYAPLAAEVDIWPLAREAVAAGKLVALPRFVAEESRYAPARVLELEEDLRVGKMGIREPAATCAAVAREAIEFMLVPGLAFDLRGGRLGRGRGYYDQLLAGFSGTTCGVAFDEQVVATLTLERHDVRVDGLRTPTRWLWFGRNPPARNW